MSWKRRSTSEDVTATVEVDLNEFDTAQLLQELIDRDVVTETQAAALLAREPVKQAPAADSDLSLARAEMLIGRRSEALIHLERHLGSEWLGRLS